MPILNLQVEVTDEVYTNALALPVELRNLAVRPAIAATFATAPNPPPPVLPDEDEDDYPRPFPYFDGDEVVTENGRRPRRPWDGVSKWDGVTTNPDDFPDFDDITAEQMASMCANDLARQSPDYPAPRDGKTVMREMRELIRQGKPLPTRERFQREQALRNGK